MEAKNERPNIRIEITNNLAEAEPMDVDEEKSNGAEEGEICDNTEIEPPPAVTANFGDESSYKVGNRIWANANGGFTTGVNIFDKQEQEKLQERAKRFALNPEEIQNFTDVDLQQLHESLGISTENEKEVRFEAVHMRGTDEMCTEDVLQYFYKYGPSFIEWVDDSSCNVVWGDTISAARALHFVSKPIKNLPVRGPCDPFVKDFLNDEHTDKDTGDGTVIKNPNREVELQEDDEKMDEGKGSSGLGNAVDLSSISCPIPPGYWRLGVEHPKAKFVLLRFSYKTDKKPYKAEKFSEYYKKYGNPNYGGLKGVISESRKQRFKGIFTRNRELRNHDGESEASKNPWASLAEKWDEDAHFREREYRNPEPVPAKIQAEAELRNSLMERLGFKRAYVPEKEEEEKPEKEDIPRKKIKIPRMRMYADEEEQKIKRKKQLMMLKAKSEKVTVEKSDLRNLLGGATSLSRKVTPVLEDPIVPDIDDNSVDLGAKLKSRKMILERIQVVKPNDRYRERTQRKEDRERRSPSQRSRRHEERLRYEYCNEDFEKQKPRSKVAVVVRTQKKPAVASAIWSRTKEQERLMEGKLRSFASNSESSSSSSSSSESSSSSNDSSSESEDEKRPQRRGKEVTASSRPGFSRHLKSSLMSKATDHKSPLKIEISNDHFRKE